MRLAGVLRRGDDCTFEAGVVKLAQTICGDAAGAQALLSQIPLDELAHLAGSRSAELQKHYEQLMDDLQHASAAAPPAASIAPDQHCRAPSAVVTQSMSSFPDLLRESHGPRVPTLRSQAGNAILRASFSGSPRDNDEIRAAPGPHVSGQNVRRQSRRHAECVCNRCGKPPITPSLHCTHGIAVWARKAA